MDFSHAMTNAISSVPLRSYYSTQPGGKGKKNANFTKIFAKWPQIYAFMQFKDKREDFVLIAPDLAPSFDVSALGCAAGNFLLSIAPYYSAMQ